MVRGYTDPAEHEVANERSSLIPSQRGVPPPNLHLSFSAPHKMILTNRRLGFPLPAQSILLLP